MAQVIDIRTRLVIKRSERKWPQSKRSKVETVDRNAVDEAIQGEVDDRYGSHLCYEQ